MIIKLIYWVKLLGPLVMIRSQSIIAPSVIQRLPGLFFLNTRNLDVQAWFLNNNSVYVQNCITLRQVDTKLVQNRVVGVTTEKDGVGHSHFRQCGDVLRRLLPRNVSFFGTITANLFLNSQNR